MGDRERLALCNMITEYIPGATVLDAFAGSGAIGIEILSRGAKKVIFIEKNPQAAKIIRENLKNLGIDGEIEQYSVASFTTPERFDVIIADPPYDKFDITEVECLVNFLKEDGILVLSHPDDSPDIEGVSCEKSRKYAGAHISIYRKIT